MASESESLSKQSSKNPMLGILENSLGNFYRFYHVFSRQLVGVVQQRVDVVLHGHIRQIERCFHLGVIQIRSSLLESFQYCPSIVFKAKRILIWNRIVKGFGVLKPQKSLGFASLGPGEAEG